MSERPALAILATLLCALLAGGCARHHGDTPSAAANARPGELDDERVLNIYNWSDYVAPDVLPAFEKEFGIKVNYDVFDSNEVLETKMLAGSTGYDVVVPSASFLERQIKAGVYQRLNRSLLPNLKNIDPDMQARLGPYDPDGAHSVNYLWGTVGIGYNVPKVAAIMPDAPLDSFRMVYDPKIVSRFKGCGVVMLDAPEDIISSVLVYLGRDPNSEAPEDLAAVEQVLAAIRPYIRYINSSRYIDDLANGEVCLALGWSGDVGQASARAREAGGQVQLRYRLPTDGSVMFFDMLAIPADAKHPRNAHVFINYMLRPEIAAKNATAMRFSTINQAAYALIDPDTYADHNFYPPPELRSRLHPNLAHTQAFARQANRLWTRFKSGL